MFLPIIDFRPTEQAESNSLKQSLTFQQKSRIMRYHPHYEFPRPPRRISLKDVTGWLAQSFQS